MNLENESESIRIGLIGSKLESSTRILDLEPSTVVDQEFAETVWTPIRIDGADCIKIQV